MRTASLRERSGERNPVFVVTPDCADQISSGILAIRVNGVEHRLMLGQLILHSRHEPRFDTGHAFQGLDGLV